MLHHKCVLMNGRER